MSVTRRAFVSGSMVTLAAAAAGMSPSSTPRRRPREATVAPFELDEVSLFDLQAGLRSGRYTALSLVKKYLSRIDAIDRGGPVLRSVIETNPDALTHAARLDHERRRTGPRGPLHGIPVLVKDNIDTHDRMQTTAGSMALVGNKASRDAFLIQRLRDSGAVILGKTNLSEWANFRGSHSTSGWSGRGGQTRNPHVLDRNPSGSSSGSAAAVAASLCAAAVGTETDGSILSPSSYCGIVGLKPTVGLISRHGIIPISSSQDTAGPMGRTVRDLAILLGVLAGRDPDEVDVGLGQGTRLGDYTTFLDARGLRGARLGVVRKLFGSNAKATRLAEEAIAALKSEGAEVIDPVELAGRSRMGDAEHTLMLYEFKAGINAYLGILGDEMRCRSLADLIEFNRRQAGEEMPWFGQETFELAEAKGPLTEKEYVDATETCRRLARREGIDATMEEHRLDALIAPTTGPAHVTDLVYGDRGSGSSTSLAAVAGYPSLTVPMGLVSGLPVGLSFFGRAWSEPVLLKLAYAFEQATQHRQPPRFVASVDAL